MALSKAGNSHTRTGARSLAQNYCLLAGLALLSALASYFVTSSSLTWHRFGQRLPARWTHAAAWKVWWVCGFYFFSFYYFCCAKCKPHPHLFFFLVLFSALFFIFSAA